MKFTKIFLFTLLAFFFVSVNFANASNKPDLIAGGPYTDHWNTTTNGYGFINGCTSATGVSTTTGISCASIYVDNEYMYYSNVINQGNANALVNPSAGYPLWYLFWQVASGPGGTGTISNSQLAPSGTVEVGHTDQDSSPYSSNSIGTHSMRICVDVSPYPNGVINESNENNNCSPWTDINVISKPGSNVAQTLDSSNYSARLYVTPTCTIPAGGSTCYVDVTWAQSFPYVDSTYQYYGTAADTYPFRNRLYFQIIRNNPDNTFFKNSQNLWIYSVTGAVDSAGGGTNIWDSVNYGVSTYKLYFTYTGTGVLLPQGNDSYYSYMPTTYSPSSGDAYKLRSTTTTNVTVTASCATGTSWSNGACRYPAAPAPIINSVSVSPNPVPYGATTNISYNASNASSCYIYLDWNYSKLVYANTGSYTTPIMTSPGSHTASVYCYNSDWVGTGWNTTVFTVNSNTYTLTINKIGSGTGTVTGAGTYNSGTTATITATPDAGSIFSGWSGSGSGCITSGRSSGSVYMREDAICPAIFVRIPIVNSVSVSPNPVPYGATTNISYNASYATFCYILLDWNWSYYNLTYANTGSYTTPAMTTTGSHIASVHCANVEGLNMGGSYAADNGWSSTVFTVNNAIPTPTPTNFKVTPSACGNNWLDLSWDIVPGAISYPLFRDGSIYATLLDNYSISTCNTSASTGTCTGSDHDGWIGRVPGLGLGSTHTYQIQAAKSGKIEDRSALSPKVSATVASACAPTVTVTPSPIVYNVAPGAIVAFTYTSSTTSTAGTECKLLDWQNPPQELSPASAYQSNSPISYAVLNNIGQYGYHIKCRDKGTNSAMATSVPITVNTVCASGTVWNASSGKCKPSSGNLTATNCFIALGGNSCPSTLVWTTSDPLGGINSVVKTPDSSGTIIATANNSTITYEVLRGSRAFVLVHSNSLLGQATATATCVAGTHWGVSSCILDNNAPNAPIITGPTTFYKNVNQTFNIKGTDPDSGDTIRYIIDWNKDGLGDYWEPLSSPYYASGYTMVSPNHSWPSSGSFQVLTQDINGAISGWTVFNFTANDQPVPASIISFTADKINPNFGQSVNLTWSSTSATSCSMTSVPNPSVNLNGLAANGTQKLSPLKTTIYSLTCTGPGGTSSATPVTVTVGKIQPTVKDI